MQKKSGGGFIWALVDEAIVRTDFNNVLDANGLNANDGIMGPHREKEGSFFCVERNFFAGENSHEGIAAKLFRKY